MPFTPAPARQGNEKLNPLQQWINAVARIDELLQREPDANEDDEAMRVVIKKWCEDVKNASAIVDQITESLKAVHLVISVRDDMAKSIRAAIAWGERLRDEDIEEEDNDGLHQPSESKESTNNSDSEIGTPRQSLRQDITVAAAAAAAQSQPPVEDGSAQPKVKPQPSSGWLVYNGGVEIGVLVRHDVAQYHKPTSRVFLCGRRPVY
ncbi:hypothetical protein BOTBODRAFT_398501 [Botryobasidium botryosum FD-172 SS1]|uniref:Uncharacterized protein n=1 Tax=Botryobasidium botryosum (strain FD-172 SS1) TaxID=930990 RepID=A0A067MNR0_BOTB1|nr:hypothetical protein BOTBODRAFT_398501 [Botryobasidium botryosum FD-172 SS1]